MKKALCILCSAFLLASCSGNPHPPASSTAIPSESVAISAALEPSASEPAPESASEESSQSQTEQKKAVQYTISGEILADERYFLDGLDNKHVIYRFVADPQELEVMFNAMDQDAKGTILDEYHPSYEDSRSKQDCEIQIYSDDIDIDALKGKRAKITGSPYFAHTFYHRREIMFPIVSVEILDES